ncbi:MAG: C25 family cysteine peptidase [Candidatus Helarchaeota archaeon]
MESFENLIIIMGKKYKETIEQYIQFKKYFFNISDENIITIDAIEKSPYYKNIKDDEIIPEIVEEYKKVIDDTNLNPIQVEGKAKFFFKISRAIKAKIKDLYSEKKIDWLLLIGDSGLIPLYCYLWKGTDSLGNEKTIKYFSDLQYVNLEEESNRISIPVSRISVSSNYSLKKVLRKILNYEKIVHEYIMSENKESDDFNWINKGFLISDMYTDTSGKKVFYEGLQELKNYLDDKISQISIINEDELEDNVIEKFNLGAVIWNYFGRGEKIGWTIPNGLNNSNIKKLCNEFKFPIVMSNCPMSGAIQYEKEKVFIQELLNLENAGAVFTTGFTCETESVNYSEINLNFFKEIFENKLNRIGKIFQNAFNKFLENKESLKAENLYEYENQIKSIFSQVLNGDTTLRIPFNLPDSEDDEPYKVITPEPEPPEEEEPIAEKLFTEWKQKISDSFFKKIYLPLDFLKNIKLESHDNGNYVVVVVRNLYEGKKIENIEIPETKNSELTYYTEEEINNAHREAPVAYEEKSYVYPISGSDETKQCPDCEGSGRLDCEYCDGGTTSSGVPCTVCEGVGTIKCERCDGSGQIVTLNIQIWKWQPVFDFRPYSSFDIDFKKQMAEISPEGTNFILKIENATPDDFGGNEELLNKVVEIYKELKETADGRTEYKGLEIIKIELQRSEADHAPVMRLICKYKEKEFDVYTLGELDRLYVFKSPNIPKSFTIIFILLSSIIAIIVILIILNII